MKDATDHPGANVADISIKQAVSVAVTVTVTSNSNSMGINLNFIFVVFVSSQFLLNLK